MDFSRPAEQLAVLNHSVDRYHIDVADGYYVGSIVLGAQVLLGIQPLMTLPIDVHIAVERPETILEAFLETDATMICLHGENTSQQFFRLARMVRNAGKKLGFVLNPLTGPGIVEYVAELVDKVTVMTVDPGFAGQEFIRPMLDKISDLRALRDRKGYSFAIEADGNVNTETIPELYERGATVMVLGSSGLFRPNVPLEQAAKDIRRFCEKLTGEEMA
jgi:D-allulose-6-phosphate 3-epimerase